MSTALHSTTEGRVALVTGSSRGIGSAIARRLGPEKLIAWLNRAMEADIQISRMVQVELLVEAFTDALGR